LTNEDDISQPAIAERPARRVVEVEMLTDAWVMQHVEFCVTYMYM